MAQHTGLARKGFTNRDSTDMATRPRWEIEKRGQKSIWKVTGLKKKKLAGAIQTQEAMLIRGIIPARENEQPITSGG